MINLEGFGSECSEGTDSFQDQRKLVDEVGPTRRHFRTTSMATFNTSGKGIQGFVAVCIRRRSILNSRFHSTSMSKAWYI